MNRSVDRLQVVFYQLLNMFILLVGKTQSTKESKEKYTVVDDSEVEILAEDDDSTQNDKLANKQAASKQKSKATNKGKDNTPDVGSSRPASAKEEL